MNIHEYQAKAVLRAFGVPIAFRFSLTERGTRRWRGISVRASWVVKSQIHAGGRGKGQFREASASNKAETLRLAHWVSRKCRAFATQMLRATLVTAQTGPSGKQVNRLYIKEQALRRSTRSLFGPRRPAEEPCAVVLSTEGGVDIERMRRRPRKRSTVSPSIPRPG